MFIKVKIDRTFNSVRTNYFFNERFKESEYFYMLEDNTNLPTDYLVNIYSGPSFTSPFTKATVGAVTRVKKLFKLKLWKN